MLEVIGKENRQGRNMEKTRDWKQNARNGRGAEAKRRLAGWTAAAIFLTSVFAAPAAAARAETVSGAEIRHQAQNSVRRVAYLRKDVTVEMNREKLEFRDEQGNVVYPLTYNGSTYLPLRAVSGLMGEPIEWNSAAKTVYLGRTLTHPVKYLLNPEESPYAKVVSSSADGKMSNILVREQRNILVMYDFETVQCRNERGETVYPINYNGSNYLPLRAVASLMEKEIVWDGSSRTVYIGSMTPLEENEVPEERPQTRAIRELFDREAEIYNRATIRIAEIGKWSSEEAPLMASGISSELRRAKENTLDAAELLKTSDLSEEERDAGEKLYAYVEITEYYILVMENIAYMAAAGEDYSILAETFLTFALESDKAMDAARKAIECL